MEFTKFVRFRVIPNSALFVAVSSFKFLVGFLSFQYNNYFMDLKFSFVKNTLIWLSCDVPYQFKKKIFQLKYAHKNK